MTDWVPGATGTYYADCGLYTGAWPPPLLDVLPTDCGYLYMSLSSSPTSYDGAYCLVRFNGSPYNNYASFPTAPPGAHLTYTWTTFGPNPPGVTPESLFPSLLVVPVVPVEVVYADAVLQEAVGADMDLVEMGSPGYVHLLSLDEHSNQQADGFTTAILNSRRNYSVERWIRMAFSFAGGAGEYATIASISFWADNLVMPPGWQVKFGVSTSYVEPVGSLSSIATDPVPTNPVDGTLAAPSLTGPGTSYSPWVVIQAHVTDPSVVAAGSLLGQTGTEVIVPTMIHYHFGWKED